jgi:hypothetical protein
VDQVRTELRLQGVDLLRYDAGQGQFLREGAGAQDVLEARLDAATVIGAEDGVIRFSAGSRLFVEKEDLAPYFGAESMAMSFSLRADAAGDVMRQHTSFKVLIDSKGGLVISLVTAEGETLVLRSRDVDLLDGQWHEIAFRFDGAGAGLQLEIDGQDQGQVAATGTLKPMASWDFQLGGGMTGDIRSLDLDVDHAKHAMSALPEPDDVLLEAAPFHMLMLDLDAFEPTPVVVTTLVTVADSFDFAMQEDPPLTPVPDPGLHDGSDRPETDPAPDEEAVLSEAELTALFATVPDLQEPSFL